MSNENEPNENAPWRQGFLRVMAKLLVVFPQGDQSELATELRIEAYREALMHSRIEDLEEAVRRAIRERGRVFMPSPGELLEHVDAIRRDRQMNEATEAARARVLTAAPPTPEEQAQVRKLLDDLSAKMRGRG